MFGDEGVDGRAVADQRLERKTATADGEVGNTGEQNDREQRQQPAEQAARLVGWSWGWGCGHPRCIHEPATWAGGSHRLVSRCDLEPRDRFRAGGRIDGPRPLPYKPRKSCADPAEFWFSWRIWGRLCHPRRHGATCGELNREADLSTEQARTQAPSRFPRAHGHQGRTQSGVGTALARTQAAERLTAATRRRALLSWND